MNDKLAKLQKRKMNLLANAANSFPDLNPILIGDHLQLEEVVGVERDRFFLGGSSRWLDLSRRRWSWVLRSSVREGIEVTILGYSIEVELLALCVGASGHCLSSCSPGNPRGNSCWCRSRAAIGGSGGRVATSVCVTRSHVGRVGTCRTIINMGRWVERR